VRVGVTGLLSVERERVGVQSTWSGRVEEKSLKKKKRSTKVTSASKLIPSRLLSSLIPKTNTAHTNWPRCGAT